MANSRSNIYPIQLQGAELNLNKFDAEIKQYSGFNKNNAPFVGGCLSNLFTKDESIIGANGDNVFIAPNGDIYEAKTDGLYKNDEKIIEYPTGTKFYEQVKINLPENLIYYYSDDIYIKKLYSNTIELNCLGVKKSIEILLQDAAYYVDKTVYDDKDFYVFVIIQKYGIQVYFFFDEDFITYHFNSRTDISTDFYNADVFFDPCVKFASSDNSYFAIIPNNNYYGGYDCILVFHFENGSVNYLYFNNSVECITANKTVLTTPYYYFTKNKYYLLKYQRFTDVNTEGEVWIQGEYDLSFSSTLNKYCIKITSYDYKSSYKNHSSISYKPEHCHLLKNWGVLYTLCIPGKNNLNNDALRLFGVTDKYFIEEVSVGSVLYDSPGAGSMMTEKTVVNLGTLINDCILTNNGLVSGITLPGGIILVSEWNSVDEKDIYFPREDNQNFFIIYKNINNNQWYKIKECTPKLKLCNTQIVTNANYYKNSFDVSDKKIKLFASGWNNRAILLYGVPNVSIYTSDLTKNNSYTAKSINEYAQENNSSIILNPVPVIVSVSWFGTVQFWNNSESELFVNNYKGVDLNEVKYISSFLLNYLGQDNLSYKFFVNKDLSGLPFPSDTNGNIAYSPSLFSEFFSSFGNDIFVKEGSNAYQLSKYNNQPIMSYYLGTLVEGLEDVFILQGQYYGIINNQIFALQFYNGVVSSQTSVVSVKGLQFCGNTPYEALFYSKTNRCLYSFTGANVLNSKQFVDKIGVVIDYEYNPATQSIFLLTDIGVLVYSLFGTYQIDIPNAKKMYLLNNGVCIVDEDNNFRYVRYYKEDAEDDFLKENIKLETCFYGMNNETVTINDCLYVRLFSEEHEEGDLEVSATTLSLKGRMTEKTTFKIKASDWDEETHSIYLRYQPKEQRGLGISFKIESPFKIASLSVGSKADAILVDKVSKGAINSPQRTSNNTEW